jgi:8-oxo-dGTP pyrophosphatase MutT (NUDIX family)
MTSYGIICLELNKKKLYNFFLSKYTFPDTAQQLKNICINKYIQKNISCNNKKDLDIYDTIVLNSIKSLIVRRNYTYNYIHLIKGLYELEIETIIKSINLLTVDEYINLTTKTFDELWINVNGNNNLYEKSKEKFNILINHILPQVENKINITYNNPEWGFPKGKKNNNETNIECARREFYEETGLKDDNYIILDRLYPLIENIKGTNDIYYKHVYYIALFNENYDTTNIKLTNLNEKFIEIGDIGIYSLQDSLDMIRDYNYEKKNIINNLKLFLTYNARYYDKFYYEKK